jgi:hypothetical protein
MPGLSYSTVGRYMGFLRCVGDFASATRRATERDWCHPGHAVRGQLRRVGSGTV